MNANHFFVQVYLNLLRQENPGNSLTLAAVSRPFYPVQKLNPVDSVASEIIDEVRKLNNINDQRSRLFELINLLYTGLYTGEDRVRLFKNIQSMYNISDDEEIKNYYDRLSNIDKFFIYMNLAPASIPRNDDLPMTIGVISELLGVSPRKTIYSFKSYGKSESESEKKPEGGDNKSPV
ncbi:MAG: hypothetical protein QXQ37_06395 [Nitrososphaerota archaeon]